MPNGTAVDSDRVDPSKRTLTRGHLLTEYCEASSRHPRRPLTLSTLTSLLSTFSPLQQLWNSFSSLQLLLKFVSLTLILNLFLEDNSSSSSETVFAQADLHLHSTRLTRAPSPVPTHFLSSFDCSRTATLVFYLMCVFLHKLARQHQHTSSRTVSHIICSQLLSKLPTRLLGLQA